MIKLDLPVPDPAADLVQQCEQQLRSYVARTESACLTGLLSSIVAIYGRYIASSGDPAGLQRDLFPKGAPCREELLHCYQSGHGKDREIIAAVERVSVGYCPYCSMKLIRKPRGRSFDRDHMLPASVFPELSILSVNLVVACDACNDGKSTKIENGQREWLWIHPYFDEFLSNCLVSATVRVVNSTVRIEYHLDLSAVPERDQPRVRRHVEELDLLQRISQYAEDSLAMQIETVAGLMPDTPLEILADALGRTAQGMLTKRANDPLGIGLLAVSRNLDALRELQAPPLLKLVDEVRLA